GAVDLSPCLDEPLLRLRQAAAEALQRIEREDRCLVLVVRVEMCAMMLTAGFHEHPNDNPEEARELRHVRTLASSRMPAHLHNNVGSSVVGIWSRTERA